MGFLDIFFTPKKQELADNNVGRASKVLESWTVEWVTYTPGVSVNYPSHHKEHRVFVTFDDAKLFEEKLEEACKLLGCRAIANTVRRYKNNHSPVV